MISKLRTLFAVGVFASAAISVAAMPAIAQEGIVAKVNGRVITEADLKLAEDEIGQDLGSLPAGTKRRVLVEYLIENELFAAAADNDKLGAGTAFDARLQYWRRRALRDAYFDKSVKGSIDDAEARKFYDEQIKLLKGEEELVARHILVDSEQKAKELAEKIKGGADFAQLAKEHSKDPGSKEDGGTLPAFSRGQMVPQFEDAAFALKTGDISAPIQSQFGWHIIQLQDRRAKQPPSFEQIKERLIASMIHRKAQDVATDLRAKANVEYLDAEIKKHIEDQQKKAAAQKRLFEDHVKQIEQQAKDKDAAKGDMPKAPKEPQSQPQAPTEGQKDAPKAPATK